MADIGILYGIIALMLVCMFLILLALWLQWRRRYTNESREFRVIFPDGSMRRTVVTSSNVWPVIGRGKPIDEDKNVLTEADHVEIILRGELNQGRAPLSRIDQIPTTTNSQFATTEC